MSSRTGRSKSPQLGFAAYQLTDYAFFALFAQLRADRLTLNWDPLREGVTSPTRA